METLRKLLNQRTKTEDGFTLVEIMVTVLIIGVLAAIAVPIFLNQSKSAKETEMKSSLLNSKTIVETERGANNGFFPNYTPRALTKGVPDTITLQYTYSTDQTAYCISASSTATSTIYYLGSASGNTPVTTSCVQANIGAPQS